MKRSKGDMLGVKPYSAMGREEIAPPVDAQEADSPLDGQIGGSHYRTLGMYQPWQVMAKWMTPEELKGYMKGTVCAYLCREAGKGGRQDIEKALHTMEIYMEVSK
jgi:hypothetical protein